MRLVGAGLFVFASMLLLVVILGRLDMFDRAPTWIVGPAIAVFMLAMMAVSQWLFNRRGSNPFGKRKTTEEHVRELEQLVYLESVSFRARRAFGVEEFEDEGLHYFLELEDGRVLFLSGQYLYDYEPISDDPELNQARPFPCTEFTVRRHKKDGYVVDLVCGGTVLEPELVAPPFGAEVWRAKGVPEDGEVLTGISYEQLKRRHGGAVGEQRA